MFSISTQHSWHGLGSTHMWRSRQLLYSYQQATIILITIQNNVCYITTDIFFYQPIILSITGGKVIIKVPLSLHQKIDIVMTRNLKILKFPTEQINYYNLPINKQQFDWRASFERLPNINSQLTFRVIKKTICQEKDIIQAGMKGTKPSIQNYMVGICTLFSQFQGINWSCSPDVYENLEEEKDVIST